MKVYDYIIVGSGCSGAMAAQTLIEGGARVLMIDGGIKSSQSEIPDKDFLSLRRNDKRQYRYFIGENGEGIDVGELGKGAQVTPARQHMLDSVDKNLPLKSVNFSPLESLGYGGLGIGWGLQCWEFSKKDLELTGLSVDKMAKAYEIVAGRIGISATKDTAGVYTIGHLKKFQPSPKMDRNHQRIYKAYEARKNKFIRQGIFVGRTPLALITKDFEGRKAYKYHGMDFYSDRHLSAWRPWITIDRLRKNKRFTYMGGQLATQFSESADGSVTLTCLDLDNNQQSKIVCKKLILATGALGTARIVLRSLGRNDTKLPILCNPHTYVPFLQPSLIGKAPEQRKLGLGELSYFIDKNGVDSGVSIASSYGYQSLMLFRVINQVPVDIASARILMRYLISGLSIMIIQHPDSSSKGKFIRLDKDPESPTGDRLFASYHLSDKEKALWISREKQYIRFMRKLHAYALKRVQTSPGSSIHYAGTLPFSETEKDFHLSPSGRLYGTKNISVADSSGFKYLPAKGLTFSLMANAHLVAENVLNGQG